MVLVTHHQYQNTSQQGYFDDVPEVFLLLIFHCPLMKSVPEPSVGCNFLSFVSSFLSFSLSFFSICNNNEVNMTQAIIEIKNIMEKNLKSIELFKISLFKPV